MSKRKPKKKKKVDALDEEAVEPTGEAVHHETGVSASGEASVEEIELSEEAAELFSRLEAERDEAVAGRQRALADYRNYQRRAMENEVRAAQDGVARVVRSLLPVMDHFDLALNQDLSQLNVEQMVGGVKIVRDELTKALELHNVQPISPEIGDEFDPNLHQAMMKQAAEGIEPNHIVMVMQPGYQLGDLILRPAKVAVAPAEEEE
ncbi:MAG: nucleotide exchange factor GrpE [Phycisphaerales bacterium]|nr:MAG: nucleotide exchange factor GrpE [Phycisphaerales bacterium]